MSVFLIYKIKICNVNFSFLTSFTEEYEEALKMTFVEQDREWLVSILERELEVEDNEEKVTHDMYMGMHLFMVPTSIGTTFIPN